MQPLLLCPVDAGGSVQGNEDMTAPVCFGVHARYVAHYSMHARVRALYCEILN